MMAAVTEMPETGLVSRARAGDRVAFEALVARLSPSLHTTAFQVVGNCADAEDVVQEALLNAYRNLGRYRAEGRFSAWLSRITRNQALMHLRAQSSRPALSAGRSPWPEAELDTRSSPARSAEQICRSREFEQLVRGCILNLPPAFREVMRLWVLEEWSHAEIAAHLGIHYALVKSRLHAGRVKLRRSLSGRIPTYGKGAP